MGVGGINQMKAEVGAYIEYAEEGGYDCLAEIAAVGQFIEIMEYVKSDEELFDAFYGYYDQSEALTFYQVYGGSYNEVDEDEWEELAADGQFPDTFKQEDMDEFNRITYVFDLLADCLGESGDNLQCGRNKRGDLVCYDYGFTFNGAWSSPAGDYVPDGGNRMRSYIENICIECLSDCNLLTLEFEKTMD